MLEIKMRLKTKEDFSMPSKYDYDSSIISHTTISATYFFEKNDRVVISRIAQPTRQIRPNQAAHTLAVMSDASYVCWCHSTFNIWRV